MGKINFEKHEIPSGKTVLPTSSSAVPAQAAGANTSTPQPARRASRPTLAARVILAGVLIGLLAIIVWNSVGNKVEADRSEMKATAVAESTFAPGVASTSGVPAPRLQSALEEHSSLSSAPIFTPSVKSSTTPAITPSLSSAPTERVMPAASPFALASALPGERFPETRLQQMTAAIVSCWTAEQIRYAINEMYARHGADFRDPDLNKLFTTASWYRRRPGVSYDEVEKSFTPVEEENVKLLGYYRDARKAGVLPQGSQPTPPNEPVYEGAPVGQSPTRTNSWRLLFAPRPAYPDEARNHHISGSGRFQIHFDVQGAARSVRVLTSTRSRVLDQSAITCLKRWRTTPGAAHDLVVPVSFADPLPHY